MLEDQNANEVPGRTYAKVRMDERDPELPGGHLPATTSSGCWSESKEEGLSSREGDMRMRVSDSRKSR